ncbi:MAG: DUF4136 domain-containing protein [Candidatus Acidiferrales bacterium]
MKYGLLLRRKSPFLAAAAVLCVFVLAGCDEHVTVTRDPDIPIPKQSTWAWRPAPPPPKNPVISRDVISRNSDASETVAREENLETDILRRQIKIGIEQTMASKGFVRVDDPQKADFLVDYHLGVHRHNVRVGYVEPVGAYPVVVCGYAGCWQTWNGGYWGPPGVSYETIRYREGTIVFDLTKQGTNRLAFRAVGYKRIDRSSFSQENVTDSVHHLLHDLKPGR